MFVPLRYQHNQFRYVRIPKPSELYRRAGGIVPLQSQYTGDELAPASCRKTDMDFGHMESMMSEALGESDS